MGVPPSARGKSSVGRTAHLAAIPNQHSSLDKPMLLASFDMFPWELLSDWLLVVSLSAFVVNVFFALGVYHDARAMGKRVEFVGPNLWAFATFFGGVFVATAYWIMHHSTLRRADRGPVAPQGDEASQPSADS